MAQRVSTTLVDDLDESEATATVSFAVDGSEYQIDLNDEHAAQLRDTFATYIGAARKAGGPPTRRRTRSTGGGKPASGSRGSDSNSVSADGGGSRVQQIRDWARANGHQVSDRGRLSRAVVQAYQAAHN